MSKLPEDRYLADLYTKDSVQAAFLQNIVDAINNLSKGTGVAPFGDTTPPPPVNALNVKVSGEQVHVTLTHAAEVTRAVKYFVEADTNPSFTQPHVVSEGHTRSHLFTLPTFNDSGTLQKWYLRAYPQYPGSTPTVPTVFGGLTNPAAVTLHGPTRMTLLPSTGSGTASTTGQQGGAGRGRQRVSTPKVLRVGKSQASIAPIQVAPTVNRSLISADASGNIDFGATPPTGGLTVGGTAFSDLAANLQLKNISSPTPSTSGPSTSSTTYVVIPEMTTTITTRGNKILLLLTMQATTTQPGGGSGNACNFAFFRDGAQITTDFTFVNAAIVGAGWTYCFAFVDTPAAGSHTFDGRWKVATNAAQITTIGIQRTFQVVELG